MQCSTSSASAVNPDISDSNSFLEFIYLQSPQNCFTSHPLGKKHTWSGTYPTILLLNLNPEITPKSGGTNESIYVTSLISTSSTTTMPSEPQDTILVAAHTLKITTASLIPTTFKE